MRVLITGGYGYLGGRIAKYLAEQNCNVVLGSRLNRIAPSWIPNAEVVKLDWSNEETLNHACSNVDIVIHAAGMNSQDCASDPVSALEVNGVAAAKLVRACRLCGVDKIIYLSTVHVYRTPLVGLFDDNTCTNNMHPYATSHLAGENVILSESSLCGLVFRLSNTVGAPTHVDANCWMLFINDICRQAVVSKSIKLSTSGEIQRDFVAIDRVNQLIANTINTKCRSGVYNVASGFSMKLITVAELVSLRCSELLGFRPKIVLGENTGCGDDLKISGMHIDTYDAGYVDLLKEIDRLLLFCNENILG